MCCNIVKIVHLLLEVISNIDVHPLIKFIATAIKSPHKVTNEPVHYWSNEGKLTQHHQFSRIAAIDIWTNSKSISMSHQLSEKKKERIKEEYINILEKGIVPVTLCSLMQNNKYIIVYIWILNSRLSALL